MAMLWLHPHEVTADVQKLAKEMGIRLDHVPANPEEIEHYEIDSYNDKFVRNKEKEQKFYDQATRTGEFCEHPNLEDEPVQLGSGCACGCRDYRECLRCGTHIEVENT